MPREPRGMLPVFGESGRGMAVRRPFQERSMQEENIGFKNTGVGIFLVVIAAFFLGFGIFLALRYGYEGILLLTCGVSLLFAVIFGALGICWLIRPKVLVRLDNENVYLYKRGWGTVPLADIARTGAVGTQGVVVSYKTASLCIYLKNGAKVSVNGVKNADDVRLRIEQEIWKLKNA